MLEFDRTQVEFLLTRIREDSNAIRAMLKTEKKVKGPRVSFGQLDDPVSCLEVGAVIHKRSDNVARILRGYGFPVIKANNKMYCQAGDAGTVWFKFKRYWKNQEL